MGTRYFFESQNRRLLSLTYHAHPQIQSHSYHHDDFVNEEVDLVEELRLVENWVTNVCGIELSGNNLQLFRPPFGSFSTELRQQSNDEVRTKTHTSSYSLRT
jgi:peptidoglycan/xylan/chitin deacetylase (PgdA/CDA1 family)